jgi:hypothetical protein
MDGKKLSTRNSVFIILSTVFSIAPVTLIRCSHNTQSTYVDPPWDKRVQEHYLALREHLKAETERLEVVIINRPFSILIS